MKFGIVVKHLPGQHTQQAHDPSKGRGARKKAENQGRKSLQKAEQQVADSSELSPELKAKRKRLQLEDKETWKLVKHYNLAENCAKLADNCGALDKYTDWSGAAMNMELRKKMGRVSQDVKKLDQLFEDLPRIPEDMSLYRGGNADFQKIINSLEVGDSFSDKGYVSTSKFERIAKDFNNSLTGGAVLEIKVKKGQKGIFTLEKSKFPNEKEMVLPRDSKFRVVAKSEGKVVVELD